MDQFQVRASRQRLRHLGGEPLQRLLLRGLRGVRPTALRPLQHVSLSVRIAAPALVATLLPGWYFMKDKILTVFET